MTSSISESFWPLAVALGVGVGFVGYCLYFDQKRRNAPDFREKLRAKRLKQKKPTSGSSSNFPTDVNNTDEMRQFFLEQIQQGEDCLARGDLENGIDHLTKAVAVCNHPESLLSLFQQTLPAELFQEIIRRLPQVAQSMMSSAGATFPSGAILTEPDLE